MILVDYSSLVMSSVFPRIAEFEDNIDLLRHQIFNLLRVYNTKFRSEFGEMVICMDGGKNWRRSKYPFYKANRRETRKNSVHDWGMIFEEINKIRDDVIMYTPFKCVRVEECEADDVIGTIVEDSNPLVDRFLIVSPDRDFVQLQKYGNVKQYSNIQKKYIEADDPTMDLNIKILKGDTGDGIPNVLSEDNVLMEENSRQTPLRKAKLESLLADPESLGVSVARRYIRNKELIDLSCTPQEIKEDILKLYNSPVEGSITSLMSLFTKHRMKLMLESLSDFEVNK